MDISVVIVNFQSRHFLSNCVSSIAKCFKDVQWEVIIVNNDSKPIEGDFLKHENLHILNTLTNFGFGKACNIGASKARGKFIFFLNPDTEIKEINVKNIIRKFEMNNLGILAPKIIIPNGNIQSWSAGNKLSFLSLIKNNLALSNDISLEERSEFDWVSGAAFIVPKELFFQKNGFDENFFMYFEDMDLCLRIKKAGFKITRLSNFKILHIGGQSYNNKGLQKLHYYASQDYYFNKNFGYTISILVKILRRFFLILK